MKNLLLYACCLLAAASYAYEVTSFSTSSSPTFIKTQDGPANLTYPVTSENTFGSPDWYEKVENVSYLLECRMIADGMVASNVTSTSYGPRPLSVYIQGWNTWPYCPYRPEWADYAPKSEWFIVYDLVRSFDGRTAGSCISTDMRFPDQAQWSDLWLEGSPYDGYICTQHDISAPGTLEMTVGYWTVDTNYVKRAATIFPVERSYSPVSYEYPLPFGETEIWLPKFHRLTPASRSALMATYEAYFERMYYGSKGIGGRNADTNEWSHLGLGSPDAGPDFVFRSPEFNDRDTQQAYFLDGFHYPGSAYSDTNNSPSARRHYPSWCFRLMDEATNVASLAYSMRGLSPFVVSSDWYQFGTRPSDLLRAESAFLVRPQWLLDGRDLAPPYYDPYWYVPPSILWWSSQVKPPVVKQTVDWMSPEKYTPDLSSVFPSIPSPEFYAEDGVTDVHIPYDAKYDLVKRMKTAQYAFTLNALEADGVFSFSSDVYPLPTLFGMLKLVPGSAFYPGFYSSSVDHMLGYDVEGLTVPGFVTNCVRQAARTLPLRADAMAVYSTRLAETSETFRVDSGPVAAASHLLGVMDRTIHIPFQSYTATITNMLGYSGGIYVGEVTSGTSNDVLELSYEGIEFDKYGYEIGFRPSGTLTSFAVRHSRTNRIERCDQTDVSYGDTFHMYASSPADDPSAPLLADVSGLMDNAPYKAFTVGREVPVQVGDIVKPIPDGEYAVFGPPQWRDGLYTVWSGPFLDLVPLGPSPVVGYKTFVFTQWPPNGTSKIVVTHGVKPPFVSGRTYQFADAESQSLRTDLGPVQCGVSPDKGSATHYAGVLSVGSVSSLPEGGSVGFNREYDFITATNRQVSSRSDLISFCDDQSTLLAKRLNDRITDLNRGGIRDPRKPGEFAPMPDWFGQEAVPDAAITNPMVLRVSLPVRITEERTFDGETFDKYVFDVTTRVETAGYVDYVCETQRTVSVTGTVDEYWNVVDYYSNDYYLDHAVTNSVIEDLGWDAYTYKVHEGTILSAITAEVVRVVMSGNTNLLTATRVVSSNVTHTTAFDATEHRYYDFMVTEYRENRFAPGEYYEWDTRRDQSDTHRPWQLPPIVDKSGTNYTETVELNPADAKSHEVVTNSGVYVYHPVLHTIDGVLRRISFLSDDPDAPTIADINEFVVAAEYVSKEDLDNYLRGCYELSAVTNNAPTNANWRGSFEGYARPAVMTWTDWDWNALKRD